jgi:hypothetical protein
MTEILKAQAARGGDVLQGLQLIDHGLWDHPAMDPNSCGVIWIFAPLGPWTQSEHPSLLSCFFPFVLILQCSRCMNRGANAPNRRKP